MTEKTESKEDTNIRDTFSTSIGEGLGCLFIGLGIMLGATGLAFAYALVNNVGGLTSAIAQRIAGH